MKLLYIDIDGVLNIDFEDRHKEDGYFLFSQKAMENLNHIFQNTGALGIISSSWRESGISLTSMREVFVRRGFLFPELLIGMTPILVCKGNHIFDRGKEIYCDRMVRGFEIPYCILDDDSRIPESENFVRCEFKTGLTEKLAQDAIKVLSLYSTMLEMPPFPKINYAYYGAAKMNIDPRIILSS